ncbi:MAG: hypothetical protein ACETWR_22980 [Anaerolineae bacterium]
MAAMQRPAFPLWDEYYHSRKNAAEGRNSQIARLGHEQAWSYGLAGAIAGITFAYLGAKNIPRSRPLFPAC